MTDAKLNQLEHWRAKLNASGLPVFSRTVREINSISTNASSSAQDLSDAIGHDASMAARVIQIANSPVINLQHREIDTISEAVVLLGFNAVRDLVITVSVIEEMLKGDQHARVGKHMARAFHAAAQARSFAHCAGDKPEEVFVGALLKQVGEMAFWSRADHEARAIEARIGEGIDTATAEREVLGFELNQLSHVLAEDWSLGELVTHVINGRHADDVNVQHVQIGHDLAETLEQHPWGSSEVRALMKTLADRLELSTSEIEEMTRANLDAAASIAERFGVKDLGDALKKAGNPESVVRTTATAEGPTTRSTESQSTASSYSAEKLLGIIDAIADGLDDGVTRDRLMPQVVLGLTQALGFSFGYFALYTSDRTQLRMKYSVDTSGDIPSSQVPCDPAKHALFADALDQTKLASVPSTDASNAWHQGGAAAAVSVRMAGRAIGLLYGEVAPQQQISIEQRKGLRQLGHQISLILSQAAS